MTTLKALYLSCLKCYNSRAVAGSHAELLTGTENNSASCRKYATLQGLCRKMVKSCMQSHFSIGGGMRFLEGRYCRSLLDTLDFELRSLLPPTGCPWPNPFRM